MWTPRYFEHWPSRALARVREAQLVAAWNPTYNRRPRRSLLSERVDAWARTHISWDDPDQDRAPYDGEDLLESWWSGGIADLVGIGQIAHALGTLAGDSFGDRIPDWYHGRLPAGRPLYPTGIP